MSRSVPPRILVVDDSATTRAHVTDVLEARGFRVETAGGGRAALQQLEAGPLPDAVLLDVNMPKPGGLETLDRMHRLVPELPVLMLSSDARVSTIVEAVRRGAYDYLTKPPDPDELERTLREVMDDRDLARRHDALQSEPHADALWDGPSMGPIRETIEHIADTDVTVLIQGESGVGKEVVARKVHAASTRCRGPFVKVNCAALPGELLESELFGYEKGAFTGAVARRPGKFEQASGGTIFLDEIGEMSLSAQAKLLHVLQDGRFSRLGGNQEIAVDVRVVSATNRPLDREVAGGSFREDLFYRLNVVALHLPPLRDRPEELDALVGHLLARSAARYRRRAPVLSDTLRALFRSHPFPGNVRELENYLKRIVVLGTEAPVIEDLRRAALPAEAPIGFEELLDQAERTAGEVPLREVGRQAARVAEQVAIRHALHRTSWNRRQAAAVLGVSYKTLLSKIRAGDLVQD